MSLHIYNSLTRELERFKPLSQEKVKIYYCGPTPYNFAHIGNLRAYLFEDMVVRTMRYLGYKVETGMNITDIDDKTIRDSQKSGENLKNFTEKYTGEFIKDLEMLHIKPADTIKPISYLIEDMQIMIQGLLDKGYAYIASDGSIYYKVEKFSDYGRLANLDVKGMISNVRIDNDEYEKDQIADFALWKTYNAETDGPNKWEISLDVTNENTADEILKNSEKKEEDSKHSVKIAGRPGWHIECSACNHHIFGEQIDIHMGGIDNLFPHHQNEIAQTEAFTGKQFSKYWMHGGHLLVDNKKMAKSAGNFFTLRDIIEKNNDFSAELVCRGFRLLSLQNKYRENFNFTQNRLDAGIKTVQGFDETFKKIARYKGTEKNTHTIARDFRDMLQATMQEFVKNLENDFDSNTALTVIFDFQREINTGMDKEKYSKSEIEAIKGFYESISEVLAVFDFSLLENSDETPKEITEIAEKRMQAKTEKDWAAADSLRDALTEKGWKMIDEADGNYSLEKI